MSVRSRRLPLTALGVLPLVLLATACGGGAEPTSAGSIAASGSSSAADEGRDSTVDDTSVDEADAKDDAASLPSGPKEPVRVTYRSSGAGAPSDMTMAWDGAKSAMIMDGMKFIFDGKTSIMCSEGQCMSLGAGADMAGAAAGGFGGLMGALGAIDDDPDVAGLATTKGKRTIAGREATCVEWKAGELVSLGQSGAVAYCFDEDAGVMLGWEFSDDDGNAIGLEATKIGKPKADDFEPTGPVQDMSSLGNG